MRQDPWPEQKDYKGLQVLIWFEGKSLKRDYSVAWRWRLHLILVPTQLVQSSGFSEDSTIPYMQIESSPYWNCPHDAAQSNTGHGELTENPATEAFSVLRTRCNLACRQQVIQSPHRSKVYWWNINLSETTGLHWTRSSGNIKNRR